MITDTSTNFIFKKTKSEIIQRLLDEKHISVEEAMTLMMSEKETQYIQVPIPQNPNPWYPNNPLSPYYYTTNTGNSTQKVPFSETQVQE